MGEGQGRGAWRRGRKEGGEISDQTIQRSVLAPSHPWCRQIEQNTHARSLSPGASPALLKQGPVSPQSEATALLTDPQAHSILTVLSIHSEAPSPGPGHPGPAQAIRKQKLALKEEKTFRLPCSSLVKGAGGGPAVQSFCPSTVTQLPEAGRRGQPPVPGPDSKRRS